MYADNPGSIRFSAAPLYDPGYEHDACGTGFVADRSGVPSRAIVQLALDAVSNLAHRGALDADGITGDGAGLLLQIPRTLLAREVERLTALPLPGGPLPVGMLFLPADDRSAAERCRQWLTEELTAVGLEVLCWRALPVHPDVLGAKARATQPAIWQMIGSAPYDIAELELERRLYLTRRRVERRVGEAGIQPFHVASLSCRTIVYKGLFVGRGLAAFYDDLRDPDCESALAIFHQRYSTNTFPTWALAQPFRRLAHNGEINTLQGNRAWMRAREAELAAPAWGDAVADLLPVIDPRGSDSASLDNVAELLELSGRSIAHVMAMLVPAAWETVPDLPDTVRDFYAWHASLTEPWDGPAALTFSDGRVVGAALDRNGLRPCRYSVTADGLVLAASEAGVVDLSGREIVERGRLGPGRILLVDTASGTLWHDDEIKSTLAAQQPYGDWNAQRFVALGDAPAAEPDPPAVELLQAQLAFGFSAEDQRLIVHPMVAERKEPLWSMGDDTPLTVLSRFERQFAGFFRQRFAQVTNPPIDSLRETLVMSLETLLGGHVGKSASRHFGSTGEIDDPSPDMPTYRLADLPLLRLPSPVLLEEDYRRLLHLANPQLRAAIVPADFATSEASGALERALDALAQQAEALVDDGHTLLVLSDRRIAAQLAPLPMPLAVGAVHQHLIRTGKRMRASLVCDTGDVWDVHQAAVLFGYGASAIHPWLALATARGLAGSRGLDDVGGTELAERYRAVLEAGIRKVMSKMGISTLASYQGGQMFEILGLSAPVVERCFTGTPSRLGGLSFDEIAERVLARHATAFGNSLTRLPDNGTVRFRRDGERHLFSPPIARALQAAVETPERAPYAAFVQVAQEREPTVLRDLLEFRATPPIPLDEVEPTEDIRRRFIVTAMSLGSLSPEAHRTLSIAMNRIGARSNGGEGGEDPDWYHEPGPDVPHSRIKQVASGRFGVTAEYLRRATELEIKIAQGSKPGEGGQIPSHKVTAFIARLRHAVPGIALISPPPHHDIYSIEDLAQLIYDLKQVNPEARVGVKLVASTGVGTIAAGVAKAYADYILISGHSGGTGASPLSSIKHAGLPWELGLAETQQTLMLNDLRGRVSLRTDGGLQTARDVVIAALLGAEEFGFGTAALVSLGCDMARQCHLNTCPTGIATQREDLRAKFRGTPEQVIAYFTHLAKEVRELLAQLGARSLDEIVGRVELLERRHDLGGPAAKLDLSALIHPPTDLGGPRRRVTERNDPLDLDTSLDTAVWPETLPAMECRHPVRIVRSVRNHQRAIGARLAGEIALRHGQAGLPPGKLELHLSGVAGQSFGAWCVPGLRLVLDGEANDYVGKGMSGGEIVIRQPGDSAGTSATPVLLGNTVLYGATGGLLCAAGAAGERFAVRNSGAVAVVEGVGDHACEYMTGGTVVVLGETGRNFAAGMTNGVAYVLDPDDRLPARLNYELVTLERVDGENARQLGALIAQHVVLTGSLRGQAILAGWDEHVMSFWKVAPRQD